MCRLEPCDDQPVESGAIVSSNQGDDTSLSRDTGVMMSRCHAEICHTEDDEKWSQHFQSEIISETQRAITLPR